MWVAVDHADNERIVAHTHTHAHTMISGMSVCGGGRMGVVFGGPFLDQARIFGRVAELNI